MSLNAAVDDRFFSVRIRETARQAGVTVDVVPPALLETEVHKRLEAGSVEAVIVDLGVASAVDRVRALKGDTRTQAVPVIGFASHVAADLIRSAKEAGCDRVLARSTFTAHLGVLLRRLAQAAPDPS